MFRKSITLISQHYDYLISETELAVIAYLEVDDDNYIHDHSVLWVGNTERMNA
jgi:hypothetical protein